MIASTEDGELRAALSRRAPFLFFSRPESLAGGRRFVEKRDHRGRQGGGAEDGVVRQTRKNGEL